MTLCPVHYMAPHDTVTIWESTPCISQDTVARQVTAKLAELERQMPNQLRSG